jgi:hypothetical protein
MRNLLICCTAILLLTTNSCQKKYYDVPVYHTGRIIRSVCGNITVQFTDGVPYGQMGWKDPWDTAHAPYDHVFRVANPCTWNAGGLTPGDEMYFKFVKTSVQNCIQCLAWAPTPDTAYSIEVNQ